MINDFIHKFVPGPSPITVLLLHGTGGDENDLLPVARAVAPGAALLSPRGKVTAQVSGQTMVRFFGLDWSDVPERAAELAAWVGEAAANYGFDPAHVIALGYSNGASLAANLMLLHPGVLSGACLLRSRTILVPEHRANLNGAPVLISAGQSDHIIPVADAEALAKLLTEAGARVDLAIQNAGHELTPADFSLAKQWFSRFLADKAV
jgi:phospholipase/carboxylesterase